MPPFLLPYALFSIILLTCASVTRGAGPAEELIQQGDVHYDKLEPTQALEFYLPAEKLDPKNARLLVRIARQYRHLMSGASDIAKKLSLGQTAISYAHRAVALAPNDPETHLSVALGYGKILPLEKSKQQITHSRLIKASVDKVIALDPENDIAWQVLGRWYLAMADIDGVKRVLAQVAYGKLPSATYEDAVKCFEKAIRLNPTRLMHFIELGRTYLKMGQPEVAKRFINKGLKMPETEKDDPETKNRGRELLKEMK